MRRLGLMLVLVIAGVTTALVVNGFITRHNTAKAFNPTTAPEIQDRLLDGFASMEFDIAKNGGNRQYSNTNYFPRGSDACPQNISSNIKVNQNCLNLSDPDLQGRAQAQNETTVAVDPFDTNNLIAASNDYRLGDGGCFPDYSSDGGRTWNDSTVPWGFSRGRAFGAAREYWNNCGDPFVIGYDTKGNAYFGALQFNRGEPTTNNPDFSSAVYVWRSTQNNGASWNFPGRPVTEDYDVTGATLQDKPYGTIDNHPGSPFANRIYVTWTDFASDGTAYLFESYSSDYGETFSQPHLVSTNSPILCGNQYGLPTSNGDCNENQFSQPFTAPDGTLYVVYDNYNNVEKTASDDRNQVLLVKSTDGGNTFGPPVKVSDYYDLPDCATYQGGNDAGRACVPEKGPTTNSIFRATNYPVGAVNPVNAKQVVVSFGSYINKDSNESNGCVPAGINPATGENEYTGVKTPGACNNKILLSVSGDAGNTFTGTTTDPRALTTVNQDPGQNGTDQFWQWMAFTKDGKLAVSYYDRQYGSDETTGYSDMSLSGSGDLTNFVVDRVTSSSMPAPTQFSGLFFGDYSGLAAWTDAHPVWMDTRDPDLFACPPSSSSSGPTVCEASASGAPASPLNDQNIFTANLPVPSK